MNAWCIILASMGLLLLLDGIALLKSSRMNWGLALTIAIGLVLLLYALMLEPIHSFVPKGVLFPLQAVFGTGIAVFAGVSLFLSTIGKMDSVDYREDVVVILGASIRQGRMSTTLRLRLQKGISYALRNPKAIILLSGGIGRGETVAEAEAMAQHLVLQGVNPNRIIIENQSKTTRENLAFSKVLLDQQLGKHYTAAFITSRFHGYRASRYAREASLPVRRLASRTPLPLLIPCYLRETLAVLRLWILKY